MLRQVPWPVPLKISGSSSPSAVGSQPLLKVRGNHPFFHPVLILQLQETPEILLFLLPGEPQKGLHPKEEEQTKLQAAFRIAERKKNKDKESVSSSLLGVGAFRSIQPQPKYSQALALWSHHNMAQSSQTKGREGLQPPCPQSQAPTRCFLPALKSHGFTCMNN